MNSHSSGQMLAPDFDGEEPQNQVLHEVDGIQEYDNKLPNWWLATLYGAIAFAVFYWYVYQIGSFAPSVKEEYERDLASLAAKEAKKIKAAAANASGPLSEDAWMTLSRDPVTLTQGKEVYTQNCVPCHKDDGGGSVGPNLTDDYWIHGNTAKAIQENIQNGFVEKGMPAWGPQLGAARVQSVAAYVLSLRGKNVPGGKAPQGDMMKIQ